MNELLDLYKEIKYDIIKRIEEFDKIYKSRNIDAMIKEMLFCILTPQSKAMLCWDCIENISKDNIYNLDLKDIKEYIKSIRFYNNKATYMYLLINKIKSGEIDIESIVYNKASVMEKREFLVKNIRGYGYKESSHFLRNIGMGENIAILDRHILKNLLEYKVIRTIPKVLSKRVYLNIENKMKHFSADINIPLSHLDLLFWYKQANYIFK